MRANQAFFGNLSPEFKLIGELPRLVLRLRRENK
jgi:hypothetical protein